MRPLTTLTKEKKEKREGEIGKPESDQSNHIMSSGLYDLLITKSY